jgi:hypothetical protein
MPPLPRTTERTISASSPVRRIGCAVRALTIARATARACRSSPSRAKMRASSAFRQRVDQIGGARALGAHAHVERPVAAEREAALGLVDLHG